LWSTSADIERLMRSAEANAALVIQASISAGDVAAGGIRVPALVSHTARHMFVTGLWDAPGLLLADYDEVTRVARALPYVRGF
jgi:hypothetical protein